MNKKEQSMSGLWNPIVKDLTPYVPGEQPVGEGVIKLNTNENPYPPSPQVFEVLQKNTNADLRLYPDPQARELTTALADFHRIDESRIFVGNGSDEVLALIFMALFHRNQPVLMPDISYSFYRVYCRLFDQPRLEVALDVDLAIVPEDYSMANGGIIFANPNAPTGLLLSLDQVRFIARKNTGSVVVVDEAYIDFGGETVIRLLDRCPNLVAIRTFSKSRSLAGLRIGYAMAHQDLVEALNRVKNSFNSYPLDRLAIAAAAASVRDRAYFETVCRRIVQTRCQLAARLQKAGFCVVPSHANFILVSHPEVPGQVIAEALKRKNIWVRRLPDDRIENFVRVSIGTVEQMDICAGEMEKMVA